MRNQLRSDDYISLFVDTVNDQHILIFIYNNFDPVSEVSGKQAFGAVFGYFFAVIRGYEVRKFRTDDLLRRLLRDLIEGIVRENDVPFPDDDDALIDVLHNALIINISLANHNFFRILKGAILSHVTPLQSCESFTAIGKKALCASLDKVWPQ